MADSRELYVSSNGDRWLLAREASGRIAVLHEANVPSGGATTRIELADFLKRGYGPEQQELLRLIGTLVGGADA